VTELSGVHRFIITGGVTWSSNGHLGQLPPTGGPTRHLSEMPCEFRWSMQHLLASLLAGVWKAVASGSSTRSSCRLNQRRRKTLGFLFAHKRHPFNRRSSAGWCCIDLLNSPDFADKWRIMGASMSAKAVKLCWRRQSMNALSLER
jgi:hypothetical protein